MAYCMNCGTQLREAAQFCTQCGVKVETDTSVVIMPQTVAPDAPPSTPQTIERHSHRLYIIILIGTVALVLCCGVLVLVLISKNDYYNAIAEYNPVFVFYPKEYAELSEIVIKEIQMNASVIKLIEQERKKRQEKQKKKNTTKIMSALERSSKEQQERREIYNNALKTLAAENNIKYNAADLYILVETLVSNNVKSTMNNYFKPIRIETKKKELQIKWAYNMLNNSLYPQILGGFNSDERSSRSMESMYPNTRLATAAPKYLSEKRELAETNHRYAELNLIRWERDGNFTSNEQREYEELVRKRRHDAASVPSNKFVYFLGDIAQRLTYAFIDNHRIYAGIVYGDMRDADISHDIAKNKASQITNFMITSEKNEK